MSLRNFFYELINPISFVSNILLMINLHNNLIKPGDIIIYIKVSSRKSWCNPHFQRRGLQYRHIHRKWILRTCLAWGWKSTSIMKLCNGKHLGCCFSMLRGACTNLFELKLSKLHNYPISRNSYKLLYLPRLAQEVGSRKVRNNTWDEQK